MRHGSKVRYSSNMGWKGKEDGKMRYISIQKLHIIQRILKETGRVVIKTPELIVYSLDGKEAIDHYNHRKGRFHPDLELTADDQRGVKTLLTLLKIE